MGIMNSIGTLMEFLLGIYTWMILIRVSLSWVNPDPYNPIVQFLVRATEPILEPFRRIIPQVAGLDISPVVALMAVNLAQRLAGVLSHGGGGGAIASLLADGLGLIHLLLTFYLLALLARSGFHLHSWYTFRQRRPPRINLNQPLVFFIFKITEPSIRPLRRWVPTIAGMDVTPMAAVMLLLLLLSLLQELILGLISTHPMIHG